MGDVWQGPGPVTECEEYTSVLRECLGERNAAPMSKAVRERASAREPAVRNRAAAECTESSARLRKSCG